MFDIAPSELMLVAAVALVVIGPKDLPRALRFVGQWVGRARGMARHFRVGIDEIVRQAELDEMQQKWAAENARIMAEHPMPPVEEADDAAHAFPNDVHVMTPLPSPPAETGTVEGHGHDTPPSHQIDHPHPAEPTHAADPANPSEAPRP